MEARALKRLLALFLVPWPVFVSAGGCASCRFQGTGTVLFLEMEGGFFGIQADTGEHYRPVDLPETFASHGLRVRFCADPIQGLLGIHMWGTPVTVREIKALGPVRGTSADPTTQ